MIYYEEWVDNYIDLLNTMFYDFLNISINRNITIPNEQRVFDDFCYMIYTNSNNFRLHNQNDFDYIK